MRVIQRTPENGSFPGVSVMNQGFLPIEWVGNHPEHLSDSETALAHLSISTKGSANASLLYVSTLSLRTSDDRNLRS